MITVSDSTGTMRGFGSEAAARLQRLVVAAFSGFAIVHVCLPAAAQNGMGEQSETGTHPIGVITPMGTHPTTRNVTFGGGASAGLVVLRGHWEPWLEAFLAAQVPLSSWVLFRAEPGVFTAATSETTGPYSDYGRGYESNTDNIRITGGLVRSFLELKVAGPVGFRLGVVAGYAVTSLDSTVCGEDHAASWLVGPLAGVAVRVGRFDFALEASFPLLMELRCNNAQFARTAAGDARYCGRTGTGCNPEENTFWWRVFHASQDELTPALLARIAYVGL